MGVGVGSGVAGAIVGVAVGDGAGELVGSGCTATGRGAAHAEMMASVASVTAVRVHLLMRRRTSRG